LLATSSASGLSWASPKQLLTEERLDIAVKWRHFCTIVQRSGDPDAERVYRWHIQHRTGGVERRSWKTSVDDYVTAARELAVVMRLHGFDPATPIILGSNGRLMEGAHRLACSLALGLDAVPVNRRTDKPGRAAPWGADWFSRHGMAETDIRRIQSDWESLTR
jgi:hypothetical protein